MSIVVKEILCCLQRDNMNIRNGLTKICFPPVVKPCMDLLSTMVKLSSFKLWTKDACTNAIGSPQYPNFWDHTTAFHSRSIHLSYWNENLWWVCCPRGTWQNGNCLLELWGELQVLGPHLINSCDWSKSIASLHAPIFANKLLLISTVYENQSEELAEDNCPWGSSKGTLLS